MVENREKGEKLLSLSRRTCQISNPLQNNQIETQPSQSVTRKEWVLMTSDPSHLSWLKLEWRTPSYEHSCKLSELRDEETSKKCFVRTCYSASDQITAFTIPKPGIQISFNSHFESRAHICITCTSLYTNIPSGNGLQVIKNIIPQWWHCLCFHHTLSPL